MDKLQEKEWEDIQKEIAEIDKRGGSGGIFPNIIGINVVSNIICINNQKRGKIKMSKKPISNNDIGISGEFYMAYILAKNGFKVNVSLGRTEGFDLFIQNPKGKNLVVSVKTTYLDINKFLLMNEKAEILIDKNLFYAFVRLNMPDGEPEFWIVPSGVVASVIKESHKIYLETPKRDGTEHKDTKIREFHLTSRDNFPNDWEKQLEGFKSNLEFLK